MHIAFIGLFNFIIPSFRHCTDSLFLYYNKIFADCKIASFIFIVQKSAEYFFCGFSDNAYYILTFYAILYTFSILTFSQAPQVPSGAAHHPLRLQKMHTHPHPVQLHSLVLFLSYGCIFHQVYNILPL